MATSARRFLSLGTAPPGGAFFVAGGALTEVLNAHSGHEGWRFTAEATAGSQENIRRLASGELDLALSNAAITYFAARGEAEWEQPYEVRSVMTLAPNVAMFLTPRGSGIETIADLAGRRVTIGPAGAGFEDFVGPILEAHAIGFDDFTPLSATQSGAVGMLADGSADAAYLGGLVPTASVTQAATSQDIHFVPYEERAIEELTARYPFFLPYTIPAGTYKGMEEDYRGLVVGAMHLITSADADEELIYEVARTLWESRDKVIERHGVGRAITEENAPRRTGTAFHPGAERFYREAGIWPEAAPGN
jgi:TRAP transporter TAXI family solute receptor